MGVAGSNPVRDLFFPHFPKYGLLNQIWKNENPSNFQVHSQIVIYIKKLICGTQNNILQAFTQDINSTMTWTDARDYCASFWTGGTLATAKSKWWTNWALKTILKYVPTCSK